MLETRLSTIAGHIDRITRRVAVLQAMTGATFAGVATLLVKSFLF
jgi:hypothetical protein